MPNQFYKLKVSSIGNPIPEATCVTLDIPKHLYKTFNYLPGQHLNIKFLIDGKEVRRSYSINSSPYIEETIQLTIKRVKGGLVSNFVGDHLKPGDELDVMIPQGRFYATLNEDDYKTYFLFAAGSGITPIYSILRSVLIASPKSVINLFYGNSTQDGIIFKKEIDQLLELHPQRLKVVHTLSQPKVWSSWEQWKGRTGRVDMKSVEWFITNHPPIAQSTEYFICGPGAMNQSVRNTLLGLQIPKELIHIEQFGGTVEEKNTEIEIVDNALLNATLNGQLYQLNIPSGSSILQVLKDAKTNPPFSCESGVCGTCTAKVIEGKAEMKSCMALEEKEINDGFILTCQAYPTSEKVSIVF